MANNIVTVNVTQTVAPAPSTLQRTGAFISQGATTTNVDATSLLTRLSDLTPLLRTPLAIASAVWSGGTVTVTTTAAHGIGTGVVVDLTMAGFTPTGYNGTYACTRTGTNTFTYALGVNPGAVSVAGTWVPAAVAEVLSMATTFFAQGSAASVYVLELGLVAPATAIANLQAFVTATDPQFFYSYLTPRNWADESDFYDYVATLTATTAKTYFFQTVNVANYLDFAGHKSVFALVQAPAEPATVFTCAAPFYRWLNYDPSTTNKVAPFAFSYLFGVTAYPTRGNAVLLAEYKAAGVNVVGTGAEGGITNTVLFWGTMMDLRDATYWYSVDWVQITLDIDIANAIINGSNNPINPLYYNQDGINRLQAAAQATMNRGITFGLVLAPVTVNAVGFAAYVADNPSDFPVGQYDGLSVSYTPARGFAAIVFNVNVTDFAAA